VSKVLVVATNERCPAVFALRSERVPFDLVLVEDDYTYGRTLAEYWQRGETFVNVEHDIVPWPGAIQEVLNCEHAWCGYDYPVGEAGVMPGAIGCVKFSEKLMRHSPSKTCDAWADTKWNKLDGVIFKSMPGHWHRHEPAVAHLTQMKEMARPVDWNAMKHPDLQVKPPDADPRLISMVTRDRGSHHPVDYKGINIVNEEPPSGPMPEPGGLPAATRRGWFND
jgi:hypothetical protein